MSEKKVYVLLTSMALLGYVYILIAFNGGVTDKIQLCMFHKITGIPCPSCGTTRGMIQLLHGHFSEALRLNALCYLQAFFLLILPFLLAIDLIYKRNMLYRVYERSLFYMNKPRIAVILIALILINWIYLIIAGR